MQYSESPSEVEPANATAAAGAVTRENGGGNTLRYEYSCFAFGAVLRAVQAGVVVPVLSADGTFCSVERSGGGTVRDSVSGPMILRLH